MTFFSPHSSPVVYLGSVIHGCLAFLPHSEGRMAQLGEAEFSLYYFQKDWGDKVRFLCLGVLVLFLKVYGLVV